MNKPIDVFKKSFLYSFLVIALLPLILKIYPFLFALYTNTNEKNNNDILSWGLDSLNGILLTGTFALVIPWLLLSFYGEFFYTRSFNRSDIFNLLKNQHIKYLGIIGLFSFFVSYIYNTYFLLDPIRPNTAIFTFLWVTYISLIIAGNSKLLRKILLYGLPVFISMIYLLSTNINIGSLTMPVLDILFLIYLGWVYKTVAYYDNDIDLNVPGKSDDELKSFASNSIFSKEFGVKPVSLDKVKSFSGFRMLTAYTRNIYMQLFLLFISIYFIFSSIYFISGIQSVFEGRDFVSQGISVFFILVMIFLNPKFMTLQGEEFLYTRAVNKSKIYLSNYFYQGLLITLIALITFIIPNISILSDFKILNIFLLTLWTFIGGEISIILLLFLSIFDLTFLSFESGNNSYLTTSLIINILSPTINSVILWGSVILFRIFDYLWFRNKEMGFIKEWKTVLLSLLKIYIPSILICLFASMFTTYNNPFTKFLNEMYDSTTKFKYSWMKNNDYSVMNSNVFSSLFFRNKEVEHNDNESYFKYQTKYNDSIEVILNNPYDEKSLLRLSREFINEISDNYRYMGSLYLYDSEMVNLLIAKAEYMLNKIKVLKNTPEYYYQRSIIEKAKGNSDTAISLALKSTENRKNSDYLYNLAEIYSHEMRNNEAIKIYEKMYFLHDKRYKALKKIGDIYWNNAEYSKAIDYYGKSTNLEGSVFQRRNYRYLGLCNELKALESKDYYNKNTFLANDLIEYSISCSNIVYDKKNPYIAKVKNKFRIRELGAEEFRYFETTEIDYAKKYVDVGDLENAEKILQQSLNIRSTKISGYLALIQIKLGKYDDAEKTIKVYLRDIDPKTANYYNPYHQNYSKYNSDVYKAMLLKDSYKDDIAKNMVLTATNPDKAFLDLQSMFKNIDLSTVENLKNQYEKIYTDFENKGLSLISGKKSIEKTRFFVKKLNDAEKIKYKDLIDYLPSLK